MEIDSIIKWIHDLSGLKPAIQIKIFFSFIVFVTVYIIKYTVNKYILIRIKDLKNRYRAISAASYVSYISTILFLMKIWIDGFGSLITIFGLVSAGLAFALQDLVKSVAGWMFIIWRSPFKVGDRIQIGGIKGDVIDIRLFKIILLEIGNWVEHEQSTGRILYLPNSSVITDNIFNYSNGLNHIWDEVGVLITFESDWKKAREDFLNIINEQINKESLKESNLHNLKTEKHLIYYKNLDPIVFVDVKDSGVQLGIRFLVEPKQRRLVKSKLWEAILNKIEASDYMELAYPTTRFFFQDK